MLRFSALALGACLVASTGHAQAVELAEDVSAPEGSETPRGFDDSASVAPARSTESVPDAPSRYGREAQRGQEALAPAVPDDGVRALGPVPEVPRWPAGDRRRRALGLGFAYAALLAASVGGLGCATGARASRTTGTLGACRRGAFAGMALGGLLGAPLGVWIAGHDAGAPASYGWALLGATLAAGAAVGLGALARERPRWRPLTGAAAGIAAVGGALLSYELAWQGELRRGRAR
ncbi:MAG TPA: hypothetical protein RMH85_04245 [Polyangiaceae bacterium LLY-WYZ-15_(1-7)]|nr:hypothetical protein [Sandaracinus sp.]MBJ72262.1 hypothetical protein [Sandaracinus sp.]HJL05264.1 hypothetical protein [Polyangiaceae bacterium LLY-WYZ-15_(1-7)]HJL07679.1 hypothetical protein [Polyangiaceae bacterium LLY-WYZ-15_(1-7)]HJL22871.1 hypothetical protein [Polyangiaceae bacterium LLY-WYZ-15_(1-7)]